MSKLNMGNVPRDKKSVGEILESLRIKKSRIAKEMGISRQAVDYQLNGDGEVDPKVFKVIVKIIEEVDPDGSLMGPVKQVSGNFYPVLKSITFIDGKIQMDKSNVQGLVFFEYGKKNNCCALSYEGDEMEASGSKFINNKDIVLIDADESIYDGDIVYVKLKTKREFIRQYFKKDDSVVLSCLNKRYSDIIIPKNEIEYMARAVRRQGESTRL